MIKIRRSTVDDALDLQDIYSRSEIYADTLQIPYASVDLWKKRLADESVIHLIASIDEKIAGHLVLMLYTKPRRKHVASFGLAVLPEYHRQGVASCLIDELFDLCDNWLNIHRIEIETFASNHAALCLYRKFGFQEEGHLKDYAFRQGLYVDVIALARIRP